jgi:hypothetical protein
MAIILIQFAQGLTVDDIIDKYVAALGGKETLVSLGSVKMDGKLKVQEFEFGIVKTISHMVGLRLDINVNGLINYQVANTTKGSVFWPSRGMVEPEDMLPEEFNAAMSQLDLQGALCNYKEKGTVVELKGKEMIDGKEVYHLNLRFKNAVISNYYIDTKTKRLLKTSENQIINGQVTAVDTVYSDYRQNEEGYWFPYIVTTSKGTASYDTISTNLRVDESLFKI